ncbi:MAG: hypothetical protein DRO88_12050 [Promethearchaeia archaeon]|nr:MAG: hypothetical protein DRO88_12050 [Candidatus Lokiarchaeia archaeon]
MNIEEVGPKLAAAMDAVPVCEGLILAKISGEVLIGQTLTELNHGEIAKSFSKLFEVDFSYLERGKLQDYTINLENGSIIAVRNEDHMLIGLLGADGKSSVGLLVRQLRNIMWK